jgi:hypothetical protein
MSISERHTWSIGDLQFLATKDNGGWWWAAMIGHDSVSEEMYTEGGLTSIILEKSPEFARIYAEKLLIAIEDYAKKGIL